jgi:NAD+ kinase
VRVGIAYHAGRPVAVEGARRAVARLEAAGIEVRTLAVHDARDDDGQAPGTTTEDPWDAATQVDSAAFAEGLDLAVSFGGDGTFLRVAHRCRAADVPMLGVNVGRLGFLAEVEMDDLDEALTAIVAGSLVIEERSTLVIEVDDASGRTVATDWALNEVAIEKSSRQRLIRLDVQVGSTVLAHVPADALIVATTTGSTAYALSAGGPIVSPRVAATLIVPVAPHSLFDRTVLVGPSETVSVSLPLDQDPGVVSSDGRDPVRLDPGGRVRVTGGGQPMRLARVGDGDFYGLVRRKFGLR